MFVNFLLSLKLKKKYLVYYTSSNFTFKNIFTYATNWKGHMKLIKPVNEQGGGPTDHFSVLQSFKRLLSQQIICPYRTREQKQLCPGKPYHKQGTVYLIKILWKRKRQAFYQILQEKPTCLYIP